MDLFQLMLDLVMVTLHVVVFCVQRCLLLHALKLSSFIQSTVGFEESCVEMLFYHSLLLLAGIKELGCV